MDRHTYSYGFPRDRKTGELVSMTPDFANSTASPLNSIDIKSARGAGQIDRLPVHKEEEKHSGNYRLIKRMRITATSARVAESDGAKRLPGLPVIKPCLTAQPMASDAQALTEALSA